MKNLSKTTALSVLAALAAGVIYFLALGLAKIIDLINGAPIQ